MKINLRTTVRTNIDTFWRKLKDPASLQYVAHPLISFRGIVDITNGESWKEGSTHHLPMYYLNLVPAGAQKVTIVMVDRDEHRIETNESGGVAKVWCHTMRLTSMEDGKVEYKDELCIEAGWKTPLLWLFVQLFYRHRQRRWRKMLQT